MYNDIWWLIFLIMADICVIIGGLAIIYTVF